MEVSGHRQLCSPVDTRYLVNSTPERSRILINSCASTASQKLCHHGAVVIPPLPEEHQKPLRSPQKIHLCFSYSSWSSSGNKQECSYVLLQWCLKDWNLPSTCYKKSLHPAAESSGLLLCVTAVSVLIDLDCPTRLTWPPTPSDPGLGAPFKPGSRHLDLSWAMLWMFLLCGWTLDPCHTLVSGALSSCIFFLLLVVPWMYFVPCHAWGCWWTLSPTVVRPCGVVSGLMRVSLPFGSHWPWPGQIRYSQLMGEVSLLASALKVVHVYFTSFYSLLYFTDRKLKMISFNVNFPKESLPWWML